MINKKGYYLSNNGVVYHCDGWGNSSIRMLVLSGESYGFYQNGESIAVPDSDYIVKYLDQEKYPEYYL